MEMAQSLYPTFMCYCQWCGSIVTFIM